MLDPGARPESAWLGATLTWNAGFVDAVGYLTLYRIYAANMSGNSIALAINSAQVHGREALAHACPLAAFFPGLIAGAVLVRACQRARWRAALMPAMVVEGLLLLLFLAAAWRPALIRSSMTDVSRTYVVAVALLSFSMGLQNGALRQTGGLKTIHTYVTGALLATAEGITEFLFWLGRRLRRRTTSRLRRIVRSVPRQRSLRTAGFAASLWTLYVIGAVAGAMLLARIGILAILAPAGVLFLIGVIDLFAPVRRSDSAPSSASSRFRGKS